MSGSFVTLNEQTIILGTTPNEKQLTDAQHAVRRIRAQLIAFENQFFNDGEEEEEEEEEDDADDDDHDESAHGSREPEPEVENRSKRRRVPVQGESQQPEVAGWARRVQGQWEFVRNVRR